MEIGGVAGGGVMLALAAGLWMVYLVPSWLRRREYDATERNAVRLQQTLRVLAETAEVPEAVRAETTARSVAEQQRTLKNKQVMDATARARDAAVARAAARELAALQPSGVAAAKVRSTAAQRLRRTRAVTSIIFLVSALALTVLLVAGLAAVAPVAVAFAGVAVVSSVALLGRLARPARPRIVAPVARQPRVVRMSAAPVAEVAEPVAERSWTPVGVPRPIYQSRSVAPQPAFDAAAVVAEMRRAAASSDEALRAAAAAPEVAPIERQAPSRFAAMGVVDDSATVTTDIDAVLRRRRASA